MPAQGNNGPLRLELRCRERQKHLARLEGKYELMCIRTMKTGSFWPAPGGRIALSPVITAPVSAVATVRARPGPSSPVKTASSGD